MTTTITFDGKTYVEIDNTNPVMTNYTCKCGNHMYVPLGAIETGLVTDCAHCGKDYPQENHCKVLTESYISLIEDESEVEF